MSKPKIRLVFSDSYTCDISSTMARRLPIVASFLESDSIPANVTVWNVDHPCGRREVVEELFRYVVENRGFISPAAVSLGEYFGLQLRIWAGPQNIRLKILEKNKFAFAVEPRKYEYRDRSGRMVPGPGFASVHRESWTIWTGKSCCRETKSLCCLQNLANILKEPNFEESFLGSGIMILKQKTKRSAQSVIITSENEAPTQIVNAEKWVTVLDSVVGLAPSSSFYPHECDSELTKGLLATIIDAEVDAEIISLPGEMVPRIAVGTQYEFHSPGLQIIRADFDIPGIQYLKIDIPLYDFTVYRMQFLDNFPEGISDATVKRLIDNYLFGISSSESGLVKLLLALTTNKILGEYLWKKESAMLLQRFDIRRMEDIINESYSYVTRYLIDMVTNKKI